VNALREALRPTPFLVGLVVGFAIPPLLTLAPRGQPTFEFELMTQGDDMSRHDVAALTVARESGDVLTQRCLGTCDDLALKVHAPGDDGFTVKAMDSAGACVACSGAYTTSSAVARLWLSGDEKLAFSHDSDTGYRR